MFTESLIHEPIIGITSCSFRFPYTEDTPPKIKKSNVFLNIPTNTDPLPNNRELQDNEIRGWVAVRHTLDRHWFIADATLVPYQPGKVIFVTCIQTEICDAIALGVDPRMKREDIDGATIVYKGDNGKWLFAHATEEEHHDRILLAETAISVVFEELLMDRLIRMDVIDIAGRSTSNRRGELTILGHINSFRNDCMKLARYNEGQLHIGQHAQEPEKYYIYKMVENAFALAEKKWKAEKPAELNQISDRIAGIKKRLSSRHTFKRRWEIPTVFPNAKRTETETESS